MPHEHRAGRLARVLARAARLRCPRCGGTRLFQSWFTMARSCALCGLVFERAQGYFVGAIYINYAVSSVIAVGGFFVLWAWFELPNRWQFAILVPFLIVFPLWFFRYSRSFWLAIEYLVNPEP